MARSLIVDSFDAQIARLGIVGGNLAGYTARARALGYSWRGIASGLQASTGLPITGPKLWRLLHTHPQVIAADQAWQARAAANPERGAA
jgi:hypothetical protein